MKRFAFILALGLFAAFKVSAQADATAKPAEENPNAPVITFENTVHDYGTVAFGGDGTCVFKFKNTGKEPLILQQPQSSCGCTVATWPKEPILPGEGNEIQVTYNTKKAGPINKTVTVKSNAKNNMIVLRITGTVEQAPNQMPAEKQPGTETPVNKPK